MVNLHEVIGNHYRRLTPIASVLISILKSLYFYSIQGENNSRTAIPIGDLTAYVRRIQSQENVFVDEFKVADLASESLCSVLSWKVTLVCRQTSLPIFTSLLRLFCAQIISMTSPNRSCDYGKQAELKIRNRFKNIVPCKSAPFP